MQGRVLVKQIIKKRITCQRKRAKNLDQKMSNLAIRSLEAMKLPFCRTGIYLFGPIYVQQRHARLKRWGALFTCFTTRAIHLEAVEGLDTDSFISSLQRFLNRRGRPGEIFSDCGTNFKGTVQELNSCFTSYGLGVKKRNENSQRRSLQHDKKYSTNRILTVHSLYRN